jgi:Fungal Zn(2)-Cys(6) binuclear cluster domain
MIFVEKFPEPLVLCASLGDPVVFPLHSCTVSAMRLEWTSQPPLSQWNSERLLPLTTSRLIGMASLDAINKIGAPALAKPCITCRKRKVKCSKSRPCSNCARAKQLCLYDDDEPAPDVAKHNVEEPADSEVRERLVRLEKLMEMMMVRENGGVARRRSLEIAVDRVAAAKDNPSHLSHRPSPFPSLSQSSYANTPQEIGTSNGPLGQILFQELHSAYFDSDFWAGLVTEVRPSSACLLCGLH